MFAGTLYARDPLGTKSSFDATTAEMLKSFHDKWYSPTTLCSLAITFWAAAFMQLACTTTFARSQVTCILSMSLGASETRAAYSVTYGCNPKNVSNARALVELDLNQMRVENVSAAELHQAKALLLRQIPLSESSEDAVGEGLLRRAETGLRSTNRSAQRSAISS